LPAGRKISFVLAGYAAAFALSCIGFLILRVDPSLPDNQGGMAAFGDFLLFGGLLTTLSLVPTAMGLIFLRPHAGFWRVLSALCLLLAATGPLAASMMGRVLPAAWAWIELFSLLKVLGSPVLALGFLIFAAIAPARRARLILLLAAALEAATAAYAILCLIILKRWLI